MFSLIGKYIQGILVALALSLALGLAWQTQRLSKALKTAQDAQTQAALYKGSFEAEKRRSEAVIASAQNLQAALAARAKEAERQAAQA